MGAKDALSPTETRTVIHAARGEAIRRCRKDGWFFTTTFVKTRDEADADSVKMFPDKTYLRESWRLIHDRQRVVVAKSRQLMWSWLLCAYCVWFARFHEHKAIFWQAQKEEDAFAMVCLPGREEAYAARMQFIVRRLPDWLRGRWKESEGELSCLDTQSLVKGLPGGANQIRGKVPSLYVADEFAFQEEQDGVYTAVAPLLQKATKAVFVSTPNGSANMFATLFHGAPVGAGFQSA